jgi:hypothetical protein
MIPLFTRKQMNRLVPAAMILILAGALAAPMAFAKVRNGTKTGSRAGVTSHDLSKLRFKSATTNLASRIDANATLADNGRHVILTGPVSCDDGERASLRVTVTQRSTGAVAEGQIFVTCNGDEQHWKIVAATQGAEDFEQGPAVAVALGRTTTQGKATDAHQWLVEITLVGE